MQLRRELVVSGRVQGVGFRPFVYRLAQQFDLSGWVRNEADRLRIQVQGDQKGIEAFSRHLLESPPLISKPHIVRTHELALEANNGFVILASLPGTLNDLHLPPDYFTCDDCLHELNDPADRRYRYPFINCTACGPRYTIIRALPYDRKHTSMSGFSLCPQCGEEYHNPSDRRFHAEPIACPQCGPSLEFKTADGSETETEAALAACVTTLYEGGIVAVKGIGGYHLLCDATNAAAVARLRERKSRPHKPLAVMFPYTNANGWGDIEKQLRLSPRAMEVLSDPSRPIVLLEKQPGSDLAENLAPGMKHIGAMLAYSPLHHLLLNDLGRPVVPTSANISGEPVLCEAMEVERHLAHVCDAFLHHNRPIERPADDSVYQLHHDQPRPIRLGRGIAPRELPLPYPVGQPLLACGGQMKNTVALAWDRRVVISPHIGDLDSVRGQEVFARVIDDLTGLYGISPATLVCDAHGGYHSSRWAAQQGLPLIEVWHHHAHASVLAGEFEHEPTWLVFCYDGIGLGPDQTLWGGEALYGHAGDWRRLGRWRPFRLPGGDKVSREPWRSACALHWETGRDWKAMPEQATLLREAWAKQINSPVTGSVGRLFDAAAAMLGVCRSASFEGQAPMWLEAEATSGTGSGIELPMEAQQGIWSSDWSPLLELLGDTGLSTADRAFRFHRSLAEAIVRQACAIRQQQGEFAVGLCGGVFQNRLLSRLAFSGLEAEGFRVYLPAQVPVNDGGLCYGQIIEAAVRHAIPTKKTDST